MPQRVYMRGQFVTADGGSAEVVDKQAARKVTIKRGAFLTSTPTATKAAPLPPDLEHFEAANQAAGPLSGPVFELQRAGIAELAARLQAVREQLQAATAKAKRK